MLTPPSVTEIRRPTTQKEELQKDAHVIWAVREQAHTGTLTDFSVFFRLLMTYRVPMMVQDVMVFSRFPENDIYYRCPRCQRLLEREFVAYCSSCGQCLDWRDYRKAKRTYYKPKR
jgi:hypothetical protein